MTAYLPNKGSLVRYVESQLVGSVRGSPLTMTIIPGKFAGYFVRIVTTELSDDTEPRTVSDYLQAQLSI